jgi:Rad51
MSKLIEEKLDTPAQNEIKNLKLKTAYDYLNQISFTVDGTSNKTIELLSTDAICLLGNSRMTNLMLTKIAVHCLIPKKYGGFRSSKVFVLDAGNCTDVYQFVDFMKQYGLNIKKNLKKIMISRVFTVYQLTHFLKYELPKTIHDYRINIVIIPDLLTMFLQEAEMDFNEIKFLVTEIVDILKVITHEGKVLLITSLSLDDDQLPPFVIDLGNKIVKSFNKCIAIDKNKTNDKFKMLIRQKQGADYIAVKKYLSLTAEDVLTVKAR